MNPYRVAGPALISFSGGRTSAFMLHQVIAAHGGGLPDDVVVAFANTGKEREETLRFVHEVAVRWSVRVHWLERREGGFEEVVFNSASRNGEPFAELIAKKQFAPNGVTRFCTTELKIRTMRDFCRSFGWKNWTNVIGLRADEMHRVAKAEARNASGKEPWRNFMPMAVVGHSRRDVMTFWREQPFDLELKPHEGNCDLCFLKARGKLEAIIRDRPNCADWWIEQERIVKGRFVIERSYADVVAHIDASPVLPGFGPDEIGEGDHDVECGLTCESDAEDSERYPTGIDSAGAYRVVRELSRQ